MLTESSPTPAQLIEAVDWTKLTGAGGKPAIKMPQHWARFEERGDQHGDFSTVVCDWQQMVLWPASLAVAPALIAYARKSPASPFQTDVVGILANFVHARGAAAYAVRLAAQSPTPNPFKPGEMIPVPPQPTVQQLEDEAAAIRVVTDQIEAELPLWLELAQSEDWETRYSACELLVGFVHHPDAAVAHDAVRATLAKERGPGRGLLEDLVMRLDA